MNDSPFCIKSVIHSQCDSHIKEYQIVNYVTLEILATTFDFVRANIILEAFKKYLYG